MVTYSDSSGESMEQAIRILDVAGDWEGVAAEYAYLERRFGERDTAWRLVSQALLQERGRWFDALQLELADGTEVSLYFDISSFFGK